MVEAAYAAGRTTATYPGAQYRRLARTNGKKRAALIVAHTLAVTIWPRLQHPHPVYVELGVDYFDGETASRSPAKSPSAWKA